MASPSRVSSSAGGGERLAVVRIVCTSDRRPWTDSGPLDLGEEAAVPPAVADALVAAALARLL